MHIDFLVRCIREGRRTIHQYDCLRGLGTGRATDLDTCSHNTKASWLMVVNI